MACVSSRESSRLVGIILTFVTAVVLVAPASALAGTIEGHVSLSSTPAPPATSDQYATGDAPEHNATPAAPNTVDEVVVYLEGKVAGRGVHPPPLVAQRDKSFMPRVLPIKVGTTVRFPNQDPFFHNVFSYSKVNRFDLGRYNTGDSRAQHFDQPGLVLLFCEIHTRMQGYILVLESDAFTLADARGDFRLEGVPPGTYTLVVWHPAFPPKSMQVTVADRPVRLVTSL